MIVIIINHGKIVYDGPLAEIKKKYLTHKHLHVTFNKKETKVSIKGCKVVEQGKYDVKLELDTKKSSVKNVINKLLADYDVADILVQDPPIEEVIQKIYKEK